MKKNLFCLLIFGFLTLSFNYAAAEKNNDTSKVSKGKYWYKLIKAKSRAGEGDYNGALRIYRKIYDNNPDDPKINFYMGGCYLKLLEMREAIGYLKVTEKLQPGIDINLHFFLGQAYQYLGKLDSALTEYSKYKALLKEGQLKGNPVNEFLSQIEVARKYMETPVNVIVKNAGGNVNSEYDDGMPSITSEWDQLFFTSRRPDTKGGGVNPETGLYYDDIYVSEWDTVNNKWAVAENNENDLNTAGQDAVACFSSEGNIIYVYRNLGKSTGSGDIYYSKKRPDGKWGKPRAFGKPVNSTYYEGSCSISPDGKTIYFVSERKGGFGNADIWTSTKIDKKTWSKPVNLGAVINSENDEMNVFLHSDGKTLFFATNGYKTMGGYDIFMTQLNDDGSWKQPLNLCYPINTSKDEKTFTMTSGGEKAYITSNREKGYGGSDIYEIDLSSYEFPYQPGESRIPVSKADPNMPVFKGSVMESNAAQPLNAEISIKDLVSGKITKTLTNEEGEYYITLKGNREYEISVEKAGYKKFSEKIKMPYDKDKILTLVKLIVLDKISEEKK